MDSLLDFNVTFYINQPEGKEDFHKQVDMALERLKLYHILKNHDIIGLRDLKQQLGDSPLETLLGPSCDKAMKSRYIDYLSHWTLKIAYSGKYPSFFIKNELRWFSLRFNGMSHTERRLFLAKNNLSLMEATASEQKILNLREKSYKIPFSEVKNLVKKRLYPLHLGYLYIPQHKIVYWLTDKFEQELDTSIGHIRKMLPNASEQLMSLISMLDLVTPYHLYPPSSLTLSELEIKMKHFPLCMKSNFEDLTSNHHLKYDSRVELGLFLKDLGLSLDDSLEMWKREFTKIMTEKRFRQEYVYFFRHQYGTVGSKIKYSAHSCDQIIGKLRCPFQNSKSLHGVSEHCQKLSKEGDYKGACTEYFRVIHGRRPSHAVNHPIYFYQESCSNGLIDIEDLFRDPD